MNAACFHVAVRRPATAALVCLALVAAPTLAVGQSGDDQRASVAIGRSGPHFATRLNTPNRFHGPLPTADAVKAMMARPGTVRDLEAVFAAAGIPYLASQAIEVLGAASPARLRMVTVPVGRRLEWMAQRVAGAPSILRNVEWRGGAPFEAYEFVLDDGVRGYTFVLPRECGNLSLASTGASPRAEAAAAEAARREAESRAADEARRADDLRRAEDARRADDARKAEEARAAEARRAAEAARAEDARRAEEARAAAAARQAAEIEADRRAKVDVFVAAFGGKERRVRELTPVTGATAAVVAGRCAGLVGGKAGPDLRLGTGGWRLAPAVGAAYNTRDSDDTSLFGEVELNYWIADKGFIGAGVGAWDLTHGKTRAGAVLVHLGRELGRTATNVRFLVVGEGRLFFDQFDDVDNNYQAWAGLRVVFR